jgi:cyclohexa-1,5-dienecarbonyl-CoA hydratase
VQSVCGPDEDPAATALAWARERLMKGSPSSLRFAHRAARRGMASGAATLLAELERFYVDELMATPDAREGIAAFLEKRPPRWGGGEKS